MTDRKVILTLSHTDYTQTLGGVEKVVYEQSLAFMENGYDVIHVCPTCQKVKIRDRIVFQKLLGYKVLENNQKLKETCKINDLVDVLKERNVSSLLIHSLIDFRFSDVFTLLDAFPQINVYYYIHDYKSVCINANLLKNAKRFCGEERKCFQKCYSCKSYWHGIKCSRDYRRLIDTYPQIIFIFPSQVSKRIWANTYVKIKEDRMLVIPHQSTCGEYKTKELPLKKLRIAYLGHQAFHKGWDAFRTLCQSVDRTDFEYYVLGTTKEQLPNVRAVNVSFLEDGPDAMIHAIRDHHIDVVFLWSICPETYSFTFFESYVCGVFVITNDCSGNIQAKVRDLQCGKVLSSVSDLVNYMESKQVLEDMRHLNTPRPTKLESNTEAIIHLLN